MGCSFVRVLRVLEALGGSSARILRVREVSGGQILTILKGRVGPLNKHLAGWLAGWLARRLREAPSLTNHLRPEASEASRLAKARVLRVLEALGGSFVRILCVREALGGSNL